MHIIKKELNQAVNYLQALKFEILTSVLLFGVATVGGAGFALLFPQATQEAFRQISEQLAGLVGEDSFQTFVYIWQNNARAMLLVVFFALFWGIPPLIFLVTNGLVLGLVSAMAAQQFSPEMLAAGILPHGIIELPGMFLAGAMGLRIGRTSFIATFQGARWLLVCLLSALRPSLRVVAAWRDFTLAGERLIGEMAQAFRFSFGVLLPALLLAAFIEAYITPLIMEWVQAF